MPVLRVTRQAALAKSVALFVEVLSYMMVAYRKVGRFSRRRSSFTWIIPTPARYLFFENAPPHTGRSRIFIEPKKARSQASAVRRFCSMKTPCDLRQFRVQEGKSLSSTPLEEGTPFIYMYDRYMKPVKATIRRRAVK